MGERIEVVKTNVNPNIDISIAKLSAPVEMLSVGKRTCRALQRAGIYTVAEIILTGKPKLGSAKHMGTLTTSRVFEAVSRFLGLPEERLAEEANSLLGTCWNPWDVPTHVLQLPDSILRELKCKGYYGIQQLIRGRTNGYDKTLWSNAESIAEVDRALNEYLGRAAQARLVRWFRTEGIPEPPSIPCPVLILPLPRLGEGPWSALKQRALQRRSLKKTGARGINGQQLRPSLRQAHDHVRQNLNVLSIFLDYFEEKSTCFQESLGVRPLELESLVEHLLPDPAASEVLLDEKEVERMILLLRNLVMYPGPRFAEELEQRWPVLLRLSCLVEPVLTGDDHLRRRQTQESGLSRS